MGTLLSAATKPLFFLLMMLSNQLLHLRQRLSFIRTTIRFMHCLHPSLSSLHSLLSSFPPFPAHPLTLHPYSSSFVLFHFHLPPLHSISPLRQIHLPVNTTHSLPLSVSLLKSFHRMVRSFPLDNLGLLRVANFNCLLPFQFRFSLPSSFNVLQRRVRHITLVCWRVSRQAPYWQLLPLPREELSVRVVDGC